MVPILSTWSVYLLVVIKLREFVFSSPTNRSLLLIRYLKTHNSIYQILFGLCLGNFLIMLALLGRKSSWLELLPLAIYLRLYFQLCR